MQNILAENTPRIETERLILRRFTPSDCGEFLAIMSDEHVNTFLPWFPLKNMSEAREFLETRYLAKYALPAAYAYAICLKADDKPIGYVNISNGESHDLGYGLRRELWHRGIVSEAAAAVVERFAQAGYPFVTATHDVKNPRSGAVMRRLGMTYRYSYVEQWQPKDYPVTFRMYQKDFDDGGQTYMKYWNMYTEHFIEKDIV